MRPEAERNIQADIRLALGREADLVLWRNPVSVGTHVSGRTQRFGLCKGSADLVGILTVRGIGVWISIEVKRPGEDLRPEQRLFRDLTVRRGAVHIVARSVDEARAGVDAARLAVVEQIRRVAA